LSAPFCSRGIRWNSLQLLARLFAVRSRTIASIHIIEKFRRNEKAKAHEAGAGETRALESIERKRAG
jgi:hypothetical protein